MAHEHGHDHDGSHGHGGGHAGHAHAHLDPSSGDRRVSIAIWANALLTVAQIVGGIFAGSLALVADALHNFSDMASLLIAFIARKIARRPADARMTFGYGRIEVVAALINYTTLILVGVYLIYEGAMRMIDPPEVAGWTVVVVGIIALVVDALTAALTWSMQKGSTNMRALFLHNLSDALGSVAVVVGGTLILLYDWRLIDPIVTIGIAGYILWLALREIGGPVRTLMLGSPPEMDCAAVIDEMLAVDGVEDIHHVHLWQMQENEAALDCHVVVEGGALDRIEEVKAALKARLQERFGIGHSTLEIEEAGRSDCHARRIGHAVAGAG
ncbi:cation diffusion facilitator family transporter [Wenxinia marina]|uniref:Cation diffusion facilitator family transporter n=1 Tax=Wenxinia marina DSM 24838 TaxID=1123501 RepID=A0A0D0NNG3_9RHOB|nr:cation diffusion facilitator family transporter [Wenxinia marina]KIQ69780.1 cation diffusion facilitator family transporter [Wenxinia marina DSM 24838]GGL61131.1 cation efflux system protein [Wenxinia marina]